MRFFLLAHCFIFVCVGCTSPKAEVQAEMDAIREETAKTLFGDPNDTRFKFWTYVDDQTDANARPVSTEIPEPTVQAIREGVSQLPWGNQDFSVSVGVGQGTLFLENHKLITVSANAELEDGTLQPLSANISESTEGGKRIIRTCDIESTEIILELLISYLNQDGEYLTMVEWQTTE
ncbi:MAG: hypothetical protein AAF483_11930 [Planctomycetota bacterium]